MSKRAEEAARKAYPEETRFIRDYNQLAKRKIYQEGYEQAEKELALTREDVKKIIKIADELTEYADAGIIQPFLASEQAYYDEVLRRFNEQRKK